MGTKGLEGWEGAGGSWILGANGEEEGEEGEERLVDIRVLLLLTDYNVCLCMLV